jgi:hypothetical protein
MNNLGNNISIYDDCISHKSNISDNNIIDKDISVYEICNENKDNSFVSNNNKNQTKNKLLILESKKIIFNDYSNDTSRTRPIKYNSNITNPFQIKNKDNNNNLSNNKILLKDFKQIKTGI